MGAKTEPVTTLLQATRHAEDGDAEQELTGTLTRLVHAEVAESSALEPQQHPGQREQDGTDHGRQNVARTYATGSSDGRHVRDNRRPVAAQSRRYRLIRV